MFDLIYEHPFYLVAVTATLMLFLLNRETYKIIKHNKIPKKKFKTIIKQKNNIDSDTDPDIYNTNNIMSIYTLLTETINKIQQIK